MEFICLLLPAFISLFILKTYNEKFYKYLTIYAIFNILINFSILLIAKVFFHTVSYLFTVSFSIKYIILASILAIIYPLIYLNREKILDINFYKKILKNIKKFLIDNKIIIYHILLFSLLTILLFIFDIKLRNISYSLSKFYGVAKWCPNIMTFAYVFLTYSLIIILPKILSKIFIILFYIFNLVLFVTHFMMLNIKEEALTMYDLGNASEGFEFLNFLIEEMSFSFIFIIVLSLVLFILIFILINKTRVKKFESKRFKYLLIVLLIFFGIKQIALFTVKSYSKNDWFKISYPKYYYDNFINSKRSMNVAGLYEYNAREIFLHIRNRNVTIGSVDTINKILKSRDVSTEDNEYTGIFKDKNLIMIMLESVDNIMDNKEVMPTMTYMKNHGLIFSKRYGQRSSSGSTIATEFTSLSGLYFLGKNYSIYNNHYNESIPNVFESLGYQTNSIHENKGIYYNRIYLHKSLGFDNSYFLLDHDKSIPRFDDEQLITNDEVYKQIVNKGDKDKFFSFIITIATHGPYENNYNCSIEETVKDEYDCVKHLANNTDNFLKLLLDRLKEDDLLNDTVIVLFSDHYAYSYNYSEKEYDLYDQVDENHIIQNLPFIIYSTDVKHKSFDDILVDDLDIVPTIYNLFGIDYDPYKFVGTDVFSPYHDNIVVFTDYSWYDGNVYSFDNNIDTTTNSFKKNTKFAQNIIDVNTMIINHDYYK